jgi:hypothetical protein
MRWIVLGLALGAAGCAASNSDVALTGTPGLAQSGAGPALGASAGTSAGGGPLGAGTADNPAGAK